MILVYARGAVYASDEIQRDPYNKRAGFLLVRFSTLVLALKTTRYTKETYLFKL
ncbi:Uncharacterised protein [Yersinia kristensenii]|nr:Uncharacterised protein [Yersinia kristensenii]